jgi:DNA repair photolyase
VSFLRLVECKSILNRTGGFLHSFTHTSNPYRGCSYGRTLCGAACYAPAVVHEKREWGTYLDAKTNAAEVYPRDLAREQRRGPVTIFMASVTDPYVPQEKQLRITRALLEAMVVAPPDRLVLQTHTPHAVRDADLLAQLECSVQVSVETDREEIPGLPPHAFPPADRLAALRTLKDAGLDAVGVVAPLLPLDDAEAFAQALDESCTRVIVDHYLVGDGSKGGARTKRRGLPAMLENQGLADWTRIEVLHATAAVFQRVLGPGRVGVSRDGFNA